jgi:ubiquinone/menaquinone biosynthesis C-methylase UbiE
MEKLMELLKQDSGVTMASGPGDYFIFDARPSNFEVIKSRPSKGSFVDGIGLNKDKVTDLLNCAESNDLRRAARYLRNFVQENITGEEDVPPLVKVLDSVVRTNLELLSKDAQPRFLSFMTLARYEAEVIAGGYQGSFILPDDLIQQLPSEGTYLSIAMGPGDNLRRMKELLSNSSFVGVDISEEMVRRAIDEDPSGIYGMADAQQLPFKYGAFDGVVMLNAIDRIPNPREALCEIARIVKPNGTVILGNCDPLQYEKEVAGGITLTYVPKENRIGSMEEALQVAGCELQETRSGLEWNINTIEDGNETLSVNLAVGKRF